MPSILLFFAAFATTPSYIGDIVFSERTDAPLDAIVVLEATNAPARSILRPQGGAPIELTPEPMNGIGAARPLMGIHPPSGGWPVDVPLDLEIYDDLDLLQVFRFDAIATPSAAPGEVTLEQVTVGDWQADEFYPGGCCTRIRTVTIRVDVPYGDAWDGAELVAAYAISEPSQLTETPIHANLDLQFGGGVREFSLLQWDDEGSVQPPCATIHARNAAGVRGPGVEVCEATLDDAASARGCSHTPSTTARIGAWALIALLARRIR